MEIRDATPADTHQIVTCLRRSITELCAEDHHNDPAILDRWLENKTAEQVEKWLSNTGWSMLVAVEQGKVISVGFVSHGGDIAMNYVLPDARFQGVSRAMVRAMEARARSHGAERLYARASGRVPCRGVSWRAGLISMGMARETWVATEV